MGIDAIVAIRNAKSQASIYKKTKVLLYALESEEALKHAWVEQTGYFCLAPEGGEAFRIELHI